MLICINNEPCIASTIYISNNEPRCTVEPSAYLTLATDDPTNKSKNNQHSIFLPLYLGKLLML
jgi:hypothetical protein